MAAAGVADRKSFASYCDIETYGKIANYVKYHVAKWRLLTLST